MPFESIEIEIDNIVAEENWVAVRYAYHSVLSDHYRRPEYIEDSLNEGLIVVPAMADFLIEDGKIAEMWRYIPAGS